MIEKLKPCPFCGCKAVLHTINSCLAVRYSVICTDKKCQGRAIKTYGYEAQAIYAWNKRANENEVKNANN